MGEFASFQNHVAVGVGGGMGRGGGNLGLVEQKMEATKF